MYPLYHASVRLPSIVRQAPLPRALLPALLSALRVVQGVHVQLQLADALVAWAERRWRRWKMVGPLGKQQENHRKNIEKCWFYGV